MIFTNARGFGKGFESEIDQCFKTANSVRIASGYASRETVDNYRDDFIRIGKKGGKSQLLLGMAYFEGLSESMISTLSSLDNKLRKTKEEN